MNMLMLSWAIACAAADAPTVAVLPPAASAVDEARARDLYRAGSEAYEASRYDVAVDAFEAALAIVRPAPLVFSAAQAHRFRYFVTNDVNHLDAAVALFREYLSLDATGTRRDHASEHLAVLAPMLERHRLDVASARSAQVSPARVIVTSPTAAARVQLDDEAFVDAPTALTLSAGEHVVRVRAPGHDDVVEKVTAVDGASFALRLPLMPTPATLVLNTADGAVVHVDGAVVDGKSARIPPGEHTVVAQQHGHRTRRQRVTVAPGSTTTVALPLQLSTQTTLGSTVVGIGGAVFVSAVVPGIVALLAENDAVAVEALHSTRALTVAEVTQYQELERRRDQANTWALGLVGVGSALVVGGALALLLDVPTDGALTDEDSP